MRVDEILQPEADDEPLILTLIRQRKSQGGRVAWYVRKGNGTTPVWIADWHKDTKRYPDGEQPVWMLHGYEGYQDRFYAIRCDKIDDDFTLERGRVKGAWKLARVKREE